MLERGMETLKFVISVYEKVQNIRRDVILEISVFLHTN